MTMSDLGRHRQSNDPRHYSFRDAGHNYYLVNCVLDGAHDCVLPRFCSGDAKTLAW